MGRSQHDLSAEPWQLTALQRLQADNDAAATYVMDQALADRSEVAKHKLQPALGRIEDIWVPKRGWGWADMTLSLKRTCTEGLQANWPVEQLL